MHRAITTALFFSLAVSAQAVPGKTTRDARALALRMDRLLGAHWKSAKIKPTVATSDAEFVRRVYLDLTGRIPEILEVRDFLENPAKDKRQQLVLSLLADERYVQHFANVWSEWFIPQGTLQGRFARAPLEASLRYSLKKNVSYAQMVDGLLTGPMRRMFDQAYRSPADQAGATSRLFLGIKLECARCHDHPFAHWKRKEFWQFAAFFTNPRGDLRAGQAPSIEVGNTGQKMRARFLAGGIPRWEKGRTPRRILLTWMVHHDNPFFARAAVNRMWAYFLGTGLIEPIDEMNAANPPSHPKLLDLVSREFIASNYDLKFLIQAITASQVYQLSSKITHPGQKNLHAFARMPVRGLSPAQLFDSLAIATGHARKLNKVPSMGFTRVDPVRAEFLRRFRDQEQRVAMHTSILQALYLMNGPLVTQATSLEHNRNLAIIADSRVPLSLKVEQLYLVTLSRKPTPSERKRMVAYLKRGGPTASQRKALTDIFWALLNSSEFSTNH